MKKLRAKIRKIKSTKWKSLTLGEKIAKVIMTLLKVAVIVAVVLAIAGVAFAVVMALIISSCIVNAIADGFNYVGYDETYVRFRR